MSDTIMDNWAACVRPLGNNQYGEWVYIKKGQEPIVLPNRAFALAYFNQQHETK